MKLSVFFAMLLLPLFAFSAPRPLPTPSLSANEGVKDDVTEEEATQAYAEAPEEFKKALKPLPEIKPVKLGKAITPDEVDTGPLVFSIEGADSIFATDRDGKSRSLRVGDELELGERIQTGEKANVRLAFEEGVQILMPPASVARFGRESAEGPAGGLDVPMVDLEKGVARFLVEGGASGNSGKTLKLLAHTKAVVIAVRGTDFILNAVDDRTNLYMISGKVEVARELTALGGTKTIQPVASESVETGVGRPLFKPEHYELGVMLQGFNKAHPVLEAFWKAALREPSERRIRARFATVRERKADQINLSRGVAPTGARKQAQKSEEKH